MMKNLFLSFQWGHSFTTTHNWNYYKINVNVSFSYNNVYLINFIYFQEPNNLNNLSSFRYNGLIHKKSVGIVSTPDNKGFTLLRKKTRYSVCIFYLNLEFILRYHDEFDCFWKYLMTLFNTTTHYWRKIN